MQTARQRPDRHERSSFRRLPRHFPRVTPPVGRGWVASASQLAGRVMAAGGTLEARVGRMPARHRGVPRMLGRTRGGGAFIGNSGVCTFQGSRVQGYHTVLIPLSYRRTVPRPCHAVPCQAAQISLLTRRGAVPLSSPSGAPTTPLCPRLARAVVVRDPIRLLRGRSWLPG